MKSVIINLTEEEYENDVILKHILCEVADRLNDGVISGVGSPVNWNLRDQEILHRKHNFSINNLIAKVILLRDSFSHMCEADQKGEGKCSCGKYDELIDAIEELKVKEL